MIAALLRTAAPSWAAGGGETVTGPVNGEIVYLEGDVTMDGKECAIGQAVPSGATVKTGPASTCEIVFGRENVMKLQEKTAAVFDLKPESPGVRLSSGSLAAVFNKVKALGSTFRVATRGTVAGVRGTAFFIRVEDENNTYVCACYGEVGVSAQGAGETALSATRHMARRFTVKDGATAVESAGLLYHDDALMNAVAARIGAAIPWGSGSYGAQTQGGSGY